MEKYPYLLTVAELAKAIKKHHDEVIKHFSENDFIEINGRISGLHPDAVKSFLKERGVDFSFSVLACINLRGGIGKTTATVSLATRAAQYGFNVCIIDLDPQGSASLTFDAMPKDDEPIFYDVWQKPEEMLPAALKPIQTNLSVLPSSLENALLDSSLMNPANQKKAVQKVCNRLQNTGFDLVLIDCPPSLGAATISSICAADTILIPIGSDAFSIKGLELTLSEIDSITDAFGIDTPQIRILFSKYDRREKISAETIDLLQTQYKQEYLPVPIRTSTDFSKALQKHQTVFASTLKSNAKDDYDLVARDILNI